MFYDESKLKELILNVKEVGIRLTVEDIRSIYQFERLLSQINKDWITAVVSIKQEDMSDKSIFSLKFSKTEIICESTLTIKKN